MTDKELLKQMNHHTPDGQGYILTAEGVHTACGTLHLWETPTGKIAVGFDRPRYYGSTEAAHRAAMDSLPEPVQPAKPVEPAKPAAKKASAKWATTRAGLSAEVGDRLLVVERVPTHPQRPWRVTIRVAGKETWRSYHETVGEAKRAAEA